MARKPRIEFEGAFYHIIIRGNQKQKIFKDKDDFSTYLKILNRYKKRYNYLLFAYILMSNHIHLLIMTREIPLSKILQGINQSYTMYFNRRHNKVGHIFQGRYKAILCDWDGYILSLLKYIHYNPVRARIVKSIDEYQWSSHHSYIKKHNNDIIDTDRILRMFSENKTTARMYYREYIDSGEEVQKKEIYNTAEQRVLGDEKFVDDIMKKYKTKIKRERIKKKYTLSEIAKGVEKITGVKMKEIRSKRKAKDIATSKILFSLVANEYSYKGTEIAEFIRKDPSVVTRHLKQQEDFRDRIEKVITLLKSDKAKVKIQD